MAIISLYCHKGGVSKTTTTFNLGWKLAEMGKKVLLVDADPQCNLTAMILGMRETEDIERFYDSSKTSDIFRVSEDFVFGAGNAKEFVLTETKSDNLFLLAGHLSLARIEHQLQLGLSISQGLARMASLPGYLSTMLEDVKKKEEIDYILIDTAPSIGALNACLVMGSDYFIVPIAPDFYSNQAIQSLGQILKSWWIDTNNFRNGRAIQGTGRYTFPKQAPKFLGTIIQNYRVRNSNPSKAFSKWFDVIQNTAREHLFPELIENGMLLDDQETESLESSMLARFSDFNSLIAKSQEFGKPVYALTKEDLDYKGVILEKEQENQAKFDKQFTDLAEIVIQKT